MIRGNLVIMVNLESLSVRFYCCYIVEVLDSRNDAHLPSTPTSKFAAMILGCVHYNNSIVYIILNPLCL